MQWLKSCETSVKNLETLSSATKPIQMFVCRVTYWPNIGPALGSGIVLTTWEVCFFLRSRKHLWYQRMSNIWQQLPAGRRVLSCSGVPPYLSLSSRTLVRIQVTIHRRHRIGRDGHLDQSKAYDISQLVRAYAPRPVNTNRNWSGFGI